MCKVACIFFPYFYASLARRENPRLGQRPLAVYRHGRVVGVSAELRGQLLPGLTLAEARGRCPDVGFVAYNDSLYKEAQNRYLKTLTSFSALIEPVSERECFFDLTGSNTEREIRKLGRCLQGEGWGPVLVGLGRNKFLARLATRTLNKGAYRGIDEGSPNRDLAEETIACIAEVPAGQEEEFMRNIPLAMDQGLSPQVRDNLIRLGFRYFGEVRELSLTALMRMLGKEGYTVYRHSRGIDNTPLVNLYPPGKIAFSLHFEGEVTGKETLERVLQEGARTLASLLRKRKKGCRLLTLYLISEKNTYQVERLVPWGCREEARLREILGILLDKAVGGEPVTGLIVEASSLYDWRFAEQDLFSLDNRPTGVRYELTAVIDSLNEKHPGVIIPGMDIDRREQVLSFWDPWRFSGGNR